MVKRISASREPTLKRAEISLDPDNAMLTRVNTLFQANTVSELKKFAWIPIFFKMVILV
jgi:hypothetical protein